MSRLPPFGIIKNVSQQEAERERLTALGGLAALSLDALSSVAYGPEAILVVLVAAGAAALKYSLPGLSRLTAQGISVALSLGDDVIAVTVAFTDADADADSDSDSDSDGEQPPEAAFHAEWTAWRLDVPLITLPSSHRSIAKPIVSYLRQIEAEDKYHRLVVLIPEVQPTRPWQWLLHNQRGIILDHAIRRGTQNVVLCRLRCRLETLAADQTGTPVT